MNTEVRVPSIHIGRDKLFHIICEHLLNSYPDDIQDKGDIIDEANELTDIIMVKGKKLALEKRTINITNQNLAKKVLNKVTNDKSDISLLAGIIYSVRKQLKHRGIKAIDNNSSEWSALKKLTPLVNEFCNDFQLSKRDGYIIYVKSGLTRISSYRSYINKLYDMSESISEIYQAEKLINDDPNKTLTKKIHDYYIQIIVKVTGILENYSDKPGKYVKFIEVGKVVNKLGVDYKTFIDAQFDGLAWTNGYPEPEQLVSDKSKERLNKYIYSSKNKAKNNNEPEKSDKNLTNVLRGIKNNNKNDKDNN